MPKRRVRNFVSPVASVLVQWGCALCLVGCQSLILTDVPSAGDQPVVDTQGLEKLLASAQWEADRNWSVLAMTSTPVQNSSTETAEQNHWRIIVPKPAAATTPPATTTSNPPDAELQTLQEHYHGLLEPAAHFDDGASELRELQAVSRKKGTPSWNAAILLARTFDKPEASASLHEQLTSQLLPEKSDATQLPVANQSAAIETWCRALSRLEGDPEENFATAGTLLESSILPEEARIELFRGIARKIPPRKIPGLNDVMIAHETDRQATPLHLAAMEACVLSAWHHQRKQPSDTTFTADQWPDGLLACRFSQDVQLRKLYGRWAALAHHPDAVTVLKTQRTDNDLGVRESAVISLGLISGDKAHQELLAVMEKGTDPERVAAAVCLSRNGLDDVRAYVHDDSPKVREAIARGIGREPSKAVAISLSEMLGDQNLDVQLAALEVCRQPQWADAGQIPLMLQALRTGSLRTRQMALAQLRETWGQEPMFPIDGTVAEREAAVRSLALEHQVSAEVFTVYEKSPEPVVTTRALIPEQSDARQIVQNFLRQPADEPNNPRLWEQLKALDPSAVTIIEHELGHDVGSRAEMIYRDVLPRLHPGYAAVLSLENSDAVVRREAAHQLLELTERGSLSPCLLRRLSQHMSFEQDRQVWQEVLGAILPDAVTDAAQIALIALNSPWPDIRQLGCEYFDRHPQPEYAAWMLPRLNDDDQQIQLRAIRILGRCGNPVALDGYPKDPETIGMRSLLMSSNTQIRWETILAMSVLGDAQASQELIRQSYDPEPRRREQAVQAMGQTGQSRFVEPLLRRSWTETDRGVQIALLRALDQLVPMNERPRLAPESSIGDKIKEWGRWWEQRQRNSAATASFTAVPGEISPR